MPVTNPCSVHLPSVSHKNTGNQILGQCQSYSDALEEPAVFLQVSKSSLLTRSPYLLLLALLQAVLSSEVFSESQPRYTLKETVALLQSLLLMLSILGSTKNCEVIYRFLLCLFSSSPWLQTSVIALFGNPLGFLLNAVSFSSLQ